MHSGNQVERWPVVSTNVAVQAAYEEMRRKGESHRVAEMLATRETPSLNTDATFLQGYCNGNQFEKSQYLGDYYRRVAEKLGQNVNGKVYLSSIARFPGDPMAWVNSKADVVAQCERAGFGCDGAVKVKPREEEEEEKEGVAEVAEDIVMERCLQKLEANPDMAEDLRHNEKKLRDFIEQTRAELRPPDWLRAA